MPWHREAPQAGPACRFTTQAALVLIAGAVTRALTRRDGGAQLLGVTLAVTACAAVALVQARWAPRWRHATKLVALLRLTVGLLGAVPFPIPEPPSASCPGYLWYWVTNSGALAAFFLSLAMSLPSAWANLVISLIQLAALGWMGCVRCGVLRSPHDLAPGVSLLSSDPGNCLLPLTSLLDWPFHMTFPHAMLEEDSQLSPRAACMACTLWLQAVAGLLVPMALLWVPAGRQPGAAGTARRQQNGSGRGWQQEGEEGGGRAPALLDRWLGEQPVLCTVFAAQLLWIVLRTACAYAAWRPTT